MMLRAAFVGVGRRAQSAHYPSVSRLEGVGIEAVAELAESRMATALESSRPPTSMARTPGDVGGDNGTLAMHRHFLECVRTC